MRTALAALSAGAGIVHAAVAVNHVGTGASEEVAFFSVAAAAQLLWAGGILVSGARWWLVGGALGNTALLAVWAVSRTAGLPLGAHAGGPMAAGLPDGVCAVLQVLLVAGAALMLTQRHRPAWRPVPRAIAAVSVLALLATVPLTAVGVGAVTLDAGQGPDAHVHGEDGHSHDDAHG